MTSIYPPKTQKWSDLSEKLAEAVDILDPIQLYETKGEYGIADAMDVLAKLRKWAAINALVELYPEFLSYHKVLIDGSVEDPITQRVYDREAEESKHNM